MEKKNKNEVIEDEIKKFAKLEALASSEGGQLLYKSLMKDVVGCIDTLTIKYNTLTHLEFISLCADMKSKLDLALIMKKAKKNKEEAQKELENALLENE